VIPTSTIGTLASEVSMYFGLRGFSHIVSTGCTSSTDAMGYAMRMIQSGMIDCVVAGGADAPLAPLIVRGFQLMRIMTQRWNEEPERGSRPFSKDRDGFVLAEGAWFFVLEERERALARGARIYGELAGYGSTCEAYHRVRLEECGEEPARSIGMALEEARIAPEAVGYLQYHGTSTELNDRIETVFLMADVSLQPIASRLVKEIAIYGGDISKFVTPMVRDEVVARVTEQGLRRD
jgi:3-oxoacyl-[acyl-carrier-protein] synthase II